MAATGHDWLSTTLRTLRKQAGLNQTQAGTAAGLGPQAPQIRLSRIESGRFVPTEDEVRALCHLYRCPVPQRRELLRAVRDLQAGMVGARTTLQRGASRLQERIRRIEADAGQVCEYQPAIIPGLLQTEHYARAVFASAGIAGPELDRATASRMGRQDVVAPGKDVTLVMAEGALRWQLGGPAVMAAQLDHLARLTGEHRIGVIPWQRLAGVVALHGFALYDQRMVIIGTRTGTAFLDDPADVADYAVLFASLTALASFGLGAQAVIRAIADGYRSLS